MWTPACAEGPRGTRLGTVPNAYISGTGYYVPPRVVTNQDLVDEYGIDTSDEWIRTRTGIEERRFSDDGVATSDLALHATEAALQSAGLDKGDLDMIILKMGIAEFDYFPSIPVKVTINEYLEIAKEYSTPKSSLFVNGILDKIVKEYQASGNLNKIGRGLR